MTRIASQLELLQQEIVKFCTNRANFEHNVRLIAVSKRQPIEKIIQALSSGQIEFAENQVQEAMHKIAQLSQSGINHKIQWHMIGPIQSNKCRQIAENFQWVQSVDREKIALSLAKHRPNQMPPLNVCIQVNLFNEEQKSGVNYEQAFALADHIKQETNLKLRGIMAIPPNVPSYNEQVANFKKINLLFNQLKELHPNMDTLSIGMSNDYKAAILAGSSMIRVGTAIFGERS